MWVLLLLQGPAWVGSALQTDVIHSVMAECSNMVSSSMPWLQGIHITFLRVLTAPTL